MPTDISTSSGVTDLLAQNVTDFTGYSLDPKRPDYAMPAYREAAPRWQLVTDIRGGTIKLREKAAWYLPRFEAETDRDWIARVRMTFAREHYGDTLQEHIGLLMAVPPKIDDDVPEELQPHLEDIDGQGNHVEVFTQQVLDSAMHLGHAVLLTDMPVTTGVIKNKREKREQKVRPYVTLYPASSIMSARFATVGGVQVLTQITFKEIVDEEDGEYGVKSCTRYRTFTQALLTKPGASANTVIITGLGPITFKVEEKSKDNEFSLVDSGTLTGPTTIPARIVYGGEKLGPLQSKPHLWGLALANIEETQITSDYAAVMHKCNVPTPVFIGRQVDPGVTKEVNMSQGIDVPVGGDAKYMEPSGAALGATRTRLEDLQGYILRAGATSDDEAGKVMTAEEARLMASQRNAKLRAVARSLQDALEGVLADMAAFLNIESGGSILINNDFSGVGVDPALMQVYISAYREGALPLEALLVALKTGRLPEDFAPEEEALKLVAEAVAREAKMAEDLKARGGAPPDGGERPPFDPSRRNAA